MVATNERFDVFSEAVWNEVIQRMEGQEAEWDGAAIRVQHGPFVVTLDLHAEVEGHASLCSTRLRAAFRNLDGFRFRLRRHGVLDSIVSWVGGRDIEVGEKAFDQAFVLKTNRPAELQQLFSSEKLRQALLQSPVRLAEIRDDEGWFGPEFPAGIDELYLDVEERIADADGLRQLYAAFAILLDRLSSVGSAG
jgi:hypothetical protein